MVSSMVKFAELVSPHCPESSAFWVHALKAVALEWQCIFQHCNQSLMHGYPFLDPFIFHTLNVSKQLHMATTGHSLAKPGPQEWRDFLYELAGAYSMCSRDSTDDRRPSKKQCTAEDVGKVFNFNLPGQMQAINIYWKKQVMLLASAIQAGKREVDEWIWQEVMWDLFKHNFQLEVLALDCCIFLMI
ncbi:hypothetical protein CPB84DRAFT_1857189 [Gymnopilus junonius]|uniref:Uncharacterized protein n=1 Tax=Gymnopilus junonius TaxID=109634 RepID=A0A9P5TEE8_GYMJU|nr:hypothetical protein CPB84DRAFT_1857189 [Gymnopilus junonius]